MFHCGDLVYLLEDTMYNDMFFKRGQEFIVVKQENCIVECELDGTGTTYIFSSCSITDNKNEVPWSEGYVKSLSITCLVFVFVIAIFVLILCLIF